MERNIKQNKRKFRLKFRQIYALFLFLVTAILAWHVVNLLVLTPMRETGVLAHGYRMENIQPLEKSWMRESENFGETLNQVDYVSIFWNIGPVVFVNVRVEPETNLSDARSAATEIVEHFIEASNEVLLYYDIQVVVSYGDVAQQRRENQEAVNQHVHEYNHNIVEAILAHAEEWPSEYNVHRAQTNINNVFTNSIKAAVGEEGLEDMRARLEALDVVVEEVEHENDENQEFMPRFPRVTRQITQSNIADFPNWGTWDNNRSRMIWNP